MATMKSISLAIYYYNQPDRSSRGRGEIWHIRQYMENAGFNGDMTNIISVVIDE